jgi:hypothetical protein
MIAFIAPLLKSFKFWAILGAVTAVMAFVRWGYGEIYQNGYNAAELKWREAQHLAINDAVADAREQWEAAAAEAAENIRVETEIVERVRVIEREVPRIVERFVTPECRDLGPDIQRVFNEAITASRADASGSDSSAEPVK